MAKQIYVDENGNPIEVSGTINNASMLPISANDSTDTKTYIDTGWSGLVSELAKKTTMYSTEIKYSGSSTTVTFNLTLTSANRSGFVLLMGDGNGRPILGIFAVHESNIETGNLVSLGSSSISATASGSTVTVTMTQWGRIQAFSNMQIS